MRKVKVLFATFLTLLGILLVLVPATSLHAQRLTGAATVTILLPVIAALAPARSRISRHQAILLPFRALLAALDACG